MEMTGAAKTFLSNTVSDLGGVREIAAEPRQLLANLFVSNMALTATGVFAVSKLRPSVSHWLGILTASYSLWTGIGLMR